MKSANDNEPIVEANQTAERQAEAAGAPVDQAHMDNKISRRKVIEWFGKGAAVTAAASVLPIATNLNPNYSIRADGVQSPHGAGTVSEELDEICCNGYMATVKDVACLRNFEPLFPGQYIYLQGHTVDGIGGGIFGHVSSSTATDNNGTVFVTSSGARWVRQNAGKIAKPEWFGAIGNGVNDDTNAINGMMSSTFLSFLLDREYVAETVQLKSGSTIQGSGKIIQKETATVCVYAEGLANIEISGLTFVGTGAPGEHLFEAKNCENIKLTSCKFEKSPRMGLKSSGSRNVIVSKCTFEHCYYYGSEFVDCKNSGFSECYFFENGDTGTHQSTSTTGSPAGRGLAIWGGHDCYVKYCHFIENTEYGLRFYTESASARSNKRLVVKGCFFKDNGVADFPVSNTGVSPYKVSDCVIRDIKVLRTVIGSHFNYSVAIQGERTLLDGFTIINESGVKAKLLGVYNSNSAKIRNGYINNTTFIDKNGALATEMEDVYLDGCDRLVSSVGSGDQIMNCKAKANSGASFAIASASGSQSGIVIDNNIFDGFDKPIVLGSSSTYRLTNNKTKNTSSWGWEVPNAFNHRGCIIHGNQWDTSRRAYENGWESNGVKNIISFTTAPLVGTWGAGDICWNSSPTSLSIPGWICVEAGTPGVWAEMASLLT